MEATDMPVRKTLRRKSDTSDLSPAEALFITGAPYDTPLQQGVNEWEWYCLFTGPAGRLTRERFEYINGLRPVQIKKTLDDVLRRVNHPELKEPSE